MKKTITSLLIFILCAGYAIAQDQRDLRKEYEDFRKNATKEYEDFRSKANAEYAEFMSKSWEEFQSFRGLNAPKFPDPVKQPVAEPVKKPTTDALPFVSITHVPAATPRPQPL